MASIETSPEDFKPKESFTSGERKLLEIFAQVLRLAGCSLTVSRGFASLSGKIYLDQNQQKGLQLTPAVSSIPAEEREAYEAELSEEVLRLMSDPSLMEQLRIGLEQAERGDVISLEVFKRKEELPELRLVGKEIVR